MEMKIYLATANENKIKELKDIIHSVDLAFSLNLISLADLPAEAQKKYNPQEIYLSPMQNAQAKAQELHKLLPSGFVLSEDSGLFVEALGGRPGVFSARFANADDEKQKKLLKEMEGIKNRKAFFLTTLCFLDEEGNAIFFNGKVSGTISENIRGKGGFGYDPIFIPDGYDKTFAEMSFREKNQISHRRKAIEHFLNYIANYLKY